MVKTIHFSFPILIICLALFTGCSKDEIDNSSKELYIGKLYGGGIIFQLDADKKHGLICAMTNQHSSNLWSTLSNTEIGSSAQSSSNGKANTAAIINQPEHTYSAAKICDEYTNLDYGTGIYSDWYLPSKDELNTLYLQKTVLNTALEADKISTTFILVDDRYWSSTEQSDDEANYQYFKTGEQYNGYKNYQYYVRAIRTF